MKRVIGFLGLFAFLVLVRGVLAADNSTAVCDTAWVTSPAYKTCQTPRVDTNDVEIPRAMATGTGRCYVTIGCRQANGQTVGTDLQFDPQNKNNLNNCDGKLKSGGC
jgi:alpha-beta hydrolase superfamily lysophospholipase